MTMTVISSGGGSVAFAVGAGGSFMDSPRRMGKVSSAPSHLHSSIFSLVDS
jgi:hypothetical protein